MLMLNRKLQFIIAGAVTLVSTGSLLAQGVNSGHSELENIEEKQIEQKVQISPGFTYLPSADFDKGSLGDVEVIRADVRAKYFVTTSEGSGFGIGALYEYSTYDFSKLADNQDVNRLSFDSYYKGKINEEWGYFAYG